MTSPAEAAPVDAGLQPERTALAWTRTMISYCTVALLVIRIAGRVGPAAVIIVAVVAVIGVAIVADGRRRYRAANAAVSAEAGAPTSRTVIATAISTCVIGILGAIAVLED